MTPSQKFTPALGYRWLTPLYDTTIGLLTREKTWRRRLLSEIAPLPGQRLLDVGCGTWSLAVMLAQAQPMADIHALDPDPPVLARARQKARAAAVRIFWHEGFLIDDFLETQAPFDTVTSSLVLHQVPLDGKKMMILAMKRALAPSGKLVIADYGHQKTRAMRFAFRATVQALDGVADTQPNADNVLPDLLRSAGFGGIEEPVAFATPTGSISIYAAHNEA